MSENFRYPILSLLLGILASYCGPRQPSIEIVKIPPAAQGKHFKFVRIRDYRRP